MIKNSSKVHVPFIETMGGRETLKFLGEGEEIHSKISFSENGRVVALNVRTGEMYTTEDYLSHVINTGYNAVRLVPAFDRNCRDGKPNEGMRTVVVTMRK